MPSTLFLHGDRPASSRASRRRWRRRRRRCSSRAPLTRQLGTQTFVQRDCCRGLIPAALLEVYAFWQDENDSLAAYPHAAAPSAAKRTRLTLQLSKFGEEDSAGSGAAQASVVLRREPINLDDDDAATADDGADSSRSECAEQQGGRGAGGGGRAARQRHERPKPMASTAQERHHWRSALAEVDTSRETLTLLNLLHAPPGSALRQLATLLRLEYLSHILVWTRKSDATLADSCDIDLVELPRLRLSFTAESSAPACACCVEHAGPRVSGRDRMDARTRELLKCLRHSLLLENEVGELSVLVSATTLPSCPTLKAAVFSTEVVLDRSNKEWISTVGNAPAYLYSVHVGKLSASARPRSPRASTWCCSASSTASTRPSSARRRCASPTCRCRPRRTPDPRAAGHALARRPPRRPRVPPQDPRLVTRGTAARRPLRHQAVVAPRRVRVLRR